MPLGVTSEEDAQVNEDYPYLPEWKTLCCADFGDVTI